MGCIEYVQLTVVCSRKLVQNLHIALKIPQALDLISFLYLL